MIKYYYETNKWGGKEGGLYLKANNVDEEQLEFGSGCAVLSKYY